MSDSETEISNDEDWNEQIGFLLGTWDQEDTPKLITDLEYSISKIESKCQELVQQLLYYKEHFEDLNNKHFSNYYPAFQEGNYNSQELENKFKKKFKEKLIDINRELKLATDKIGLKDGIFLFSTEDYLKAFHIKAVNQMKKCLCKVKEDFIKTIYTSRALKSDFKNSLEKEFDVSKITKDDLLLYQTLSRIKLKKRKISKRIKKLKKTICTPADKNRKRWKISFRRRLSVKTKHDFIKINKVKSSLSKKKQIKKNKTRETEVSVVKRKSKERKKYRNKKKYKPKTYRCFTSKTPNVFKSKYPVKKNWIKNLSDIDLMCNVVIESICKENKSRKIYEATNDTTQSNHQLQSRVHKKIPFTACTSTSKSFNIGVILQHFQSLKKYKKELTDKNYFDDIISTEKKVTNNDYSTKNTNNNFIMDNVQEHFNHAYTGSYGYLNYSNNYTCETVQDRNRNQMSSYSTTNTNNTLTTCLLRPGVPKNSNSIGQLHNKKNICGSNDFTQNVRKRRSKYTKSSPERLLERHEMVNHYRNEEKAMIKSETKTTCTVSSKIMFSDCHRTEFCKIRKNSYCNNNSGDCSCNTSCNQLKEEWNKIYSNFLDLYRKYSSIKGYMNAKESNEPNLKLLEEEIQRAIEEYEHFVMDYGKFLYLKHQLKSLKPSSESADPGPITSHLNNPCKRQNSYTFTSTVTMRKSQINRERSST